MSLLLCRQEAVTRPYYMETLDIHLYSSQELCYVIFHHPLLVMDGFIDEGLVQFVREELNMGALAARLERDIPEGGNQDELLFLILSECFYYSSQEISQYRQTVSSLRKKSRPEYAKEKADYLFQVGQMGKAVKIYESLLEEIQFSEDENFRGRVWNNLGAAYARMFQTEKAFQAFEQAYGCLKDQNMVKKMYFLTKFNPSLELSGICRAVAAGEGVKERWDKEAEKAREQASQSRDILKLDQLFERDRIKRSAGTAELVRKWKQDYRSML